ncbi:hypothetical protein QYE76_026339 [Lolium multiflorum]|uniref:F-box domain-containing protein n=1 Tax=Lolium multiflorum TaxID=4521 RepID=A0AAD8VV22_LOLMU|nr:hypothetical protein QYE76_026339 [Lolium multiflorum]
METPAACEIDRLPEELLVNVVWLTSPIDACRAAAVSRAFRATADSDAVWSGFLPRNLPQFAKGELPRKAMSKKELFRRLSGQPVLLPHKIIGMQLDRATGAERLTLSSRALQTRPGNSGWYRVHVDSVSHYNKRDSGWRQGHVDSVSNYSKRDRRFLFSEVVFWFSRLEIRAKIQRKILSQNTTYAVYMVFKLNLPYYPDDIRIQEASIGVAGRESTRQVCLQGYVVQDDTDETDDDVERYPSMESASCDIMRLPRELLAVIVSLTSPPDACRAAAVSRAFCAAADSDAVWSCFLPSDLPRFAEGELPPIPPSTKKGTFLRLYRLSVLLPCRLRVHGEVSMETASCEIVRLPEELLATIISLTSPPDACRASAVSRAFCTVAGSDAVWSCFVPSLPRFAEGELSNTPRATKKGMFLCLSDQPALLPCKLIINPGKHEKYKKVLFLDPSFFTDEMHMPPAWASAAPPHKPWTGWNPRTEGWSTNLGATAPPSTPTRSAGLDNTNNIPKVVNANAAITATGEGIKRAATPRATATPRTMDSAWNSTGAARSKKSAAVFKRLSAGATSSVAPPAATPRTPKLYTRRDPLIPRPPAAEAAAGGEESDESPAASWFARVRPKKRLLSL